MTTVQIAGAIPAQRSAKPALPWFTGDVSALTALLRRAAAESPEGDALKALIWIEAIQDRPRMSAAMKARLTAAVIQALQILRGWDAPLAEPADHPFADLTPGVEQSAPVAEPVEDGQALDPSMSGDVRAVTAQLRIAAAGRPNGDAVQAMLFIETIHDRAAGLAAVDKNRLTVTVLDAFRSLRGWTEVSG